MHGTITFGHGLASFDVTADPVTVLTRTNKKQTLTCGTIKEDLPRVCPKCKGPMDIHQDHYVLLRHVPLQTRPHNLRIRKTRTRCRHCDHTEIEMQGIPFKDPEHNITKHLRYLIERHLAEGETLKAVSREFEIHPSIVKDIDKLRLQRMFKGKRPPSYSKYIAIDEFLLHKGHHYATVVIDLESGGILWCEEGKKKEQVYNFIAFMGPGWMSHVKAVCMDMNAQYDSAFRERCPKIAVIFDKFHIMRLYNDRVLTSMLRRKQKELKDAGDQEGYELNRLAIMGIRWKAGSRKMHRGSSKLSQL